MVHRVRAEVVQRNDAGDDGSERGGNSRIAHVAYMPLAFDGEVMNFGLERFSHLRGGSGKINQHTAGVDNIHLETMRFEPGRHCVEVGLRQAEAFAEFLGGYPVVKIWRAFAL